jgi:hypothetical protein
MGGLDGVAKQIEVKVVAVVKNTTIETLTSNAVTLTVTPYEVVIIYPHLNLPGSYTTYDGSSWSGSGTPYSRIYSLKFDNKYEGYIYMVNGGSPANAVEFKFTKVNWGDGEYSYSGTPGTLVSGGGGNISLASGGYYKVNADLNALTYSVYEDKHICNYWRSYRRCIMVNRNSYGLRSGFKQMVFDYQSCCR